MTVLCGRTVASALIVWSITPDLYAAAIFFYIVAGILLCVILRSSVISFINAYQLKMNNSQDTRARTGNLLKETLLRKSGNAGQKRGPRT